MQISYIINMKIVAFVCLSYDLDNNSKILQYYSVALSSGF